MNKANVGYTLFYGNGEMNLNYFNYKKVACIRDIESEYDTPWSELKKDGFSVRKITAKEHKIYG